MATQRITKLLKQPKIIILILLVLWSLWVIPSHKGEGAEVSFVDRESPFFGFLNDGDIITGVNGVPIHSLDDYTKLISDVQSGSTLTLTTNKNQYSGDIQLDENNETFIGVNVRKIPASNIDLGLDLQGGARVMVQPVPTAGVKINDEVISTTINVLTNRLNAYGLQGVELDPITDVQGNKFIQVSMAGAGSEKVVDLVKSVGKFEIKILNETAAGGDAIVPPVGDPRQNTQTGQWGVPFTVSLEGGQAIREKYKELVLESPVSCSVSTQCDEGFGCAQSTAGSGLCLPLISMVLDDVEVFSAPPAMSLHQSWINDVNTNNMVVQTGDYEQAQQVKIVLEAGRWPGQIEALKIVSQTYIDARLGKDFVQGALYAGIAALIAVSIIIFIKYRKIKISVPILLVSFSELVIILGIFAFAGWDIDLPAIAGLIALLGTGVDHQVIITDEILSVVTVSSLKRRIKKAFTSILVAAFTTIAAMTPLVISIFPGLKILQGFALVTVLGVLIAITITRPAYAKIAEFFYEDIEG